MEFLLFMTLVYYIIKGIDNIYLRSEQNKRDAMIANARYKMENPNDNL